MFLIRCTIKLNNICTKNLLIAEKKGKREVQGMPQSQTAALPRQQEAEETDKLYNVLVNREK